MLDLFFGKEKEIEKYEPPKKPSHFDIYNKMIKGNVTKEDEKYFNGYLYTTQLSFKKEFLPLALILNQSFVDNRVIFEIAKVYANKTKFIKFIKKDKPDKDLETICWYFKVNKETAKRYKKMLSKEELKEIKELYNEVK